jgi:hypothetical protein
MTELCQPGEAANSYELDYLLDYSIVIPGRGPGMMTECAV